MLSICQALHWGTVFALNLSHFAAHKTRILALETWKKTQPTIKLNFPYYFKNSFSMHFFPLIWRKSYIFLLAWSYTLILLEELAPSELTIFTGFHTETEKAFSSGQPHVWTCNKCREVIQSLEEQEGSLRQDLKISVQSSWSTWSKCVRSVKITQPQQENPPGKRLTRGRIIQQWEEGGPGLRTDTSRSYKVSLECQIYFKVRNELGNPSYLSLVNKSTRVRSWYIEYSVYIAPVSRCSSEHPNKCESSFDSYWAVNNSELYEWSKQKNQPRLYITKNRLFCVLWRKDTTRRWTEYTL